MASTMLNSVTGNSILTFEYGVGSFDFNLGKLLLLFNFSLITKRIDRKLHLHWLISLELVYCTRNDSIAGLSMFHHQVQKQLRAAAAAANLKECNLATSGTST